MISINGFEDRDSQRRKLRLGDDFVGGQVNIEKRDVHVAIPIQIQDVSVFDFAAASVRDAKSDPDFVFADALNRADCVRTKYGHVPVALAFQELHSTSPAMTGVKQTIKNTVRHLTKANVVSTHLQQNRGASC